MIWIISTNWSRRPLNLKKVVAPDVKTESGIFQRKTECVWGSMISCCSYVCKGETLKRQVKKKCDLIVLQLWISEKCVRLKKWFYCQIYVQPIKATLTRNWVDVPSERGLSRAGLSATFLVLTVLFYACALVSSSASAFTLMDWLHIIIPNRSA